MHKSKIILGEMAIVWHGRAYIAVVWNGTAKCRYDAHVYVSRFILYSSGFYMFVGLQCEKNRFCSTLRMHDNYEFSNGYSEFLLLSQQFRPSFYQELWKDNLNYCLVSESRQYDIYSHKFMM